MKRCVRRVPAELPSFNCESFAPKNENGPKESEGEIEKEIAEEKETQKLQSKNPHRKRGRKKERNCGTANSALSTEKLRTLTAGAANCVAH